MALLNPHVMETDTVKPNYDAHSPEGIQDLDLENVGFNGRSPSPR